MAPTAHVITVSDRAFNGVYTDRSGPLAVDLLRDGGCEVDDASVVPDDLAAIQQAIRQTIAAGVRVVLTTGGTGVSPRDCTVEATRPLLTAELPGGPSIADLLSTAVEACQDHALRSRTIEIAMASLGSGWPVGRTASYDADLAETTLRILDGNDVPRVADPPVEVTAVSFQADVEDVDELSSDALAEFGFLGPIEG